MMDLEERKHLRNECTKAVKREGTFEQYLAGRVLELLDETDRFRYYRWVVKDLSGFCPQCNEDVISFGPCDCDPGFEPTDDE